METNNQTIHAEYAHWQEQRDIAGIVTFDMENQIDTIQYDSL